MSYKFLLFGTGIGSNYGCDAIVLGTERILHQSFPECEIWFPHNSWKEPKYGAILGSNNGITICNSSSMIRAGAFCRRIAEKALLTKPKTINLPKTHIKKSDCVLSIGGDLYTFADKEKDWPFPYSIMDAGNKIIQLGKPYIIWCASVGPLEKAGKRLPELVNHLENCRAIIVREQESYIYLRETIGLKNNLYLAADPAFVMTPEPFVFPFLNENNSDKLLAINFSLAPLEHVYGDLPVEQLRSDLVCFVQKILDNFPVKILFVPHVNRDHKLIRPIVEHLSKKNVGKIEILPEKIGAQKTKWAVSQANLLITMRFHCALAGFSTNTPTMLLVSTSKGTKICKEMYGDTEYGVKIADMSKDEVISKISTLLETEEMIRTKLENRCKTMKERALSAGEILSKIL